MPIFGNNTCYDSSWILGGNVKSGTRFYLGVGAKVEKITCYCSSASSGAKARCGIYDDEGEQPNNLIAQSQESGIPSPGSNFQWVDFVFDPQPEIMPGWYWLTIQMKLIWNYVKQCTTEETLRDTMIDSYDDGLSNPWGSHDITEEFTSAIYATYEELPIIQVQLKDTLVLSPQLINPPYAGGYYILGFWVRKVRAKYDKIKSDDHNIPRSVLRKARDVLGEGLF